MQKRKKKKGSQTEVSDIPTQTKKRIQSPSEKKHLQTKAQSELYRDARAAFNKYLYTKKKIKTSKVPL